MSVLLALLNGAGSVESAPQYSHLRALWPSKHAGRLANAPLQKRLEVSSDRAPIPHITNYTLAAKRPDGLGTRWIWHPMDFGLVRFGSRWISVPLDVAPDGLDPMDLDPMGSLTRES